MRKIYLLFMIMFAFVSFASAQTMENFESLKMNVREKPEGDLSSFTVVPNPDRTAANPSFYVAKFLRDKDGTSTQAFYATVDTPVDFTENKYIHVKVWKPRISGAVFMIERADGNIQVNSKYPQTVTEGWQDLVFDFSETAATGEYSKIVFMPDSINPVGLTEDIVIYLDDIVLNNNPNPRTVPTQTINVDMSNSKITAGATVWVAGALGGSYGSWKAPGTVPELQMFDTDGDGIYTVKLNLPDGIIAFKFFWGGGWANGDDGVPDRTVFVAGDMELTYKYGTAGVVSEVKSNNIILENYESLIMNVREKPAGDSSSFSVVPNPDASGVNLSPYVAKFHRDKDGTPTQAFYATLDTPVDFTENKYVHIKVWKPRISDAVFMIERADGNIQVNAKYPLTATEGWQDLVFDFSATAATGEYSKIVFMPDFIDPVNLTDDIVIYFDDLVLNNKSEPVSVPKQIINVDMKNSGITAGATVWISGAIGGIYGTWKAPGTVPELQMFDPDGDGIYTATLNLPDGLIAFKFFWGGGWKNGDDGVPDRVFTVKGDANLSYVYGVEGYKDITSAKQISGATFKVFPNPTEGMITIQSPDIKGLTVYDISGRTLKAYKFMAVNSKEIDLGEFKPGIYLLSVETANGTYTSKLIKK